jgi:predicted Rossmann fold nucleotide-binding protein DprA/Smf involved in DNA uptake
MQRNKLIYALADAALVVSADVKKGGTWAGAIEQLEKLKLLPVFARRSDGGSPGLDALAKKGALPWPEPVDADGLNAVLATPAPERAPSPGQTQLSFDTPREGADEVRDAENPASGSLSIAPPSTREPDLSPADELFATMRSLVLRLAREPMKATDIARGLGVTAPQAQKWLGRLVEDGTLEKSKRPARYFVREVSCFEEPEDPRLPSLARKRPGSRK